MDAFPDIMTMDQAAQFLQVSVRTIQRMIKAEEIPGRRVGGQWRFDRDQLRAWVRGEVEVQQSPDAQARLIEDEARRVGADVPQMYIDLQQEARRRLEGGEDS